MKEVVVLRIGFNPTRSTSPCYNNYTLMQYTVIQKIRYQDSPAGSGQRNDWIRQVAEEKEMAI